MPMDFINQNVLLIALVVISGLALLWPALVRPAGNAVNPAEATSLINREDAHIVDVRDAEEFASGHLPDALNIPASKLTERVGELELCAQLLYGLQCAQRALAVLMNGDIGEIGTISTECERSLELRGHLVRRIGGHGQSLIVGQSDLADQQRGLHGRRDAEELAADLHQTGLGLLGRCVQGIGFHGSVLGAVRATTATEQCQRERDGRGPFQGSVR